ncbi:hypothetical protein [Insolitispirillum peregrinum]|uniref:hypothetical protein n=1 Tax=Insolitispirillum peregrinum TaxID=80876 RepID=UPI00361FCBB2
MACGQNGQLVEIETITSNDGVILLSGIAVADHDQLEIRLSLPVGQEVLYRSLSHQPHRFAAALAGDPDRKVGFTIALSSRALPSGQDLVIDFTLQGAPWDRIVLSTDDLVKREPPEPTGLQIGCELLAYVPHTQTLVLSGNVTGVADLESVTLGIVVDGAEIASCRVNELRPQLVEDKRKAGIPVSPTPGWTAIVSPFPCPTTQTSVSIVYRDGERTLTWPVEVSPEVIEVDDGYAAERAPDSPARQVPLKLFIGQNNRWGQAHHREALQAKVERQLADAPGKRLLAIYDTADMPFSFDFLGFLCGAEGRRQALGLEAIDLCIMAHQQDPSPDRHAYVTSESFRHRMCNLLFEAARLLPSLGSTFHFNNRQQLQAFLAACGDSYQLHPGYYDVTLPHELNVLDRAASHMLLPASQWARDGRQPYVLQPPNEMIYLARKWMLAHCYPRIPVTVTLRDWGKDSERNSNVAAWQALVDHFADAPICFILLPDFNALYEPAPLTGPNVVLCNEAVVQLSLRAAFYDQATFNLMTVGGPSEVTMCLRDGRFMVFNYMHHLSAGRPVDALFQGFPLSHPRPGAHEYEKIILSYDTPDRLIAETTAMFERLQQDRRWTPGFYEQVGAPGNARLM